MAIQYPKVLHKLPELFRLIIESDHKKDEMKEAKVTDINVWKAHKAERQLFTWGAEKFIKEQKKDGNGNATV